MTDPIADMLARIRNATQSRHPRVDMPLSRLKVEIAKILEGEMFQGRGAIILPAVAIVMTAVGVLAAIGPARQGLSIHPTEALRDE